MRLDQGAKARNKAAGRRAIDGPPHGTAMWGPWAQRSIIFGVMR
ncbi:hypothetical protein [Marivita sp. S6314]|nr:hypothetical protein [Marivita sp. S6314]